MWHSLERLDPCTGAPLPRYMSMLFFNIVYRARRLLAGRSADEIRMICEVLNGIRRAPGFEDPAFANIRNWEPLDYRGPNGRTVEAMPSPSDAGELLHNVDRIDLRKLDNPPKAEWYELFGTMALSFVDKAARVEASKHRRARRRGGLATVRDGLHTEIAEYAVTGMEAVTIGESLLRPDKGLEAMIDHRWAALLASETEKRLATNRRKIARAGGIAKGRETAVLIAELFGFWSEGDFKSPRDATIRFVEYQPKHRFVHLKEPIDRLYKGLLRRIKGSPGIYEE